MHEITKLSLKDTISALHQKNFSCVELVSQYIKNIEANSKINAYITKTFDLALDLAKKSDENIAKNNIRNLEGMPIGVKDIFCTKNVRTTCASKMLADFIPTYESTVTANLWNNGALMLGKINMDEFAMGSANMNSYFGPVINPLKANNSNETLVPGGSSGGSSAAVAANLCVAALGSDTGGSVRQPAAFTGIVGVKPTYGLCSRYGMIAFASSLDQAGVLTKTVADSAILLENIVSFDRKDSTSIKRDHKKYSQNIKADVKGKKIGIISEYINGNISEEIKKNWQSGMEALKNAGAEIIEISLPKIEYSLIVYYIIAPAECSANLARYDGVRYGYRTESKVNSLEEMYEKTRSEGFGYEVKRRILTGTYVLSAGYYDAYYRKAQKIRRIIAEEFKNAFQNVDVIMCPSTPTSAFHSEDKERMKDPTINFLNDVFTVPANIAGLPAISVAFGKCSRGLPLSLQVIGNLFDEQKIFDTAMVLEEFNNRNI